ncbi:hypothetical protein [Chryseobacterium sp. JV274]|uniref:hypothetical protein n=1 Tax=Chryseobacterium sp. JV274 TaxID=1932669 RepID=UPI0015C25761|nr:hypothetical protein [Chryseobacterium sp. JV274]CAD0221306.1 conserved membrane protein of unknown function [Chryseobacterium sp. JV274]
MEKGCYTVNKNEEIPFDIIFAVKPNISQVTENQQKLHLEIEKTLVVVRKLFENSTIELHHYFSQLLSLAQAGLTPEDNAQPIISFNALQQLKAEIIDKKSGEIKNTYFKTLGVKASYLGSPILLFCFIIKILYYFTQSDVINNLSTFSNFLFIWCASLLGVWLSFGARKTTLTFEELTTIEEDRLEPTIRLIFVGIISMIFALLFYKEAVVLEIGKISTKAVTTDSFTAIIFGIFLGLSEKFIGQKLTKKATSLFESI